jgi:hypothetical protein
MREAKWFSHASTFWLEAILQQTLFDTIRSIFNSILFITVSLFQFAFLIFICSKIKLILWWFSFIIPRNGACKLYQQALILFFVGSTRSYLNCWSHCLIFLHEGYLGTCVAFHSWSWDCGVYIVVLGLGAWWYDFILLKL